MSEAHDLDVARHGWTPPADAALTQMWVDGVPSDEIGDYLNTSRGSVFNRRRALNLPSRGHGGSRYGRPAQHTNIADRLCLGCSTLFRSQWIDNRLCDPCTRSA